MDFFGYNGLIGLLVLAGDIWAIINIAQSSASNEKKLLWILVVLILPLLGLIPLISLWCGTGEFAKVFVVFLAAFYPMVTSSFDGVRRIDHRYFELAYSYELTRAAWLRDVLSREAQAGSNWADEFNRLADKMATHEEWTWSREDTYAERLR